MQSGKLNVRIQIQGETISRNQYGEEIVSFGTIHTVMAKQRAITGLKNEVGDSITSESKIELYIRYIPALSTKMRVVIPQKFMGVSHQDIIYRIESIIDSSDGKKRELKIVCKVFE